jgi:hypothetical protein
VLVNQEISGGLLNYFLFVFIFLPKRQAIPLNLIPRSFNFSTECLGKLAICTCSHSHLSVGIAQGNIWAVISLQTLVTVMAFRTKQR